MFGFDRLARAIAQRIDSGRPVDEVAYQNSTGRFAVALRSPPRSARPPEPPAVRRNLERLTAAVSPENAPGIDAGWCRVETPDEVERFARTLDAALARGRLERERGEALAAVGHELRTPLTSIRGYIETLLDGELDAATTRRFLETARREALRLGRLLDGMLEFSMLDLCGRPDVRCDVVEQIRATIEATAPFARERRIAITASLPSTAPARLEADACMHVLVNVVENAIKYGTAGGRVDIACGRNDPFVLVTVDDDGPGVPAYERESIFELGRRGSAVSQPGTGIGLAIVKTIADRAGGSIGVAPSPLGGARFTLRLPCE